MRATARAYVISPPPSVAWAPPPGAVRDRFSAAYLVAVAAEAVHDVGALGRGAGKEGRRLSTLTLETEVRFATAEARAAFAEEMARAVARLNRQVPRREGARRARVPVRRRRYPAIPREE